MSEITNDWHKMLDSYSYMAIVGVKGLMVVH